MQVTIAINLTGKVGDVIEQKYGIDKKLVHGGASIPFHQARCDTSFRCDPALFLDGLNDLVDYRLKMMTQKPAASPRQPRSPSGPA